MRAIGDIDDAYLAEADPAQLLSAPQTASAPRRRAFHAARWGALAAGVCLLLLLPLVWRFVGRGGMTAKEDVSFAPAADGFRDGEALSGAQPAETTAAAALTTAPTTTAAAAETSGAPSTTVYYPEATGAPTTTRAPVTTTAPITTTAPFATDAPVTTAVPTYYAPPAVGTYVWETPEGEGMKSTVTLTEDGHFTFLFPAEGSSVGTGSCSLAEDVLTLTAIDGRVWYFAVEEGALRYLAHASDKTWTAALPDDARFILQ